MAKNRLKILLAEREMSARDLAEKLGKQPHTIRRYIRQESQPRVSLANQIAEILECTMAEVVGYEEKNLDAPPGRKTLPIYGAAQGGEGFDITDVSAPIDAMPVPELLQACPTAYAVYVSGESMAPRYLAGEKLFVHPGIPVAGGDFVVIQFSDQNTRHAVVKRFISTSDETVMVEQFNPQKKISYPRATVEHVHKIVGTSTK
jgi:phage repressor protein C with HTH and peptisase S24 domain